MFTGGFRSIFPPTFDAGLASKWWLAGGVAAGDCVAAYQAKGAASYAASKVNLANPGTYDAADGAAYPTWYAATGWTFDGTKWLTTEVIPQSTNSMIVSMAGSNSSYVCGCSISNTHRFSFLLGSPSYWLYGTGAAATVSSPAVTGGVLALAGVKAYRDGDYLSSSGSLWGNLSIGCAIGAARTTGGAVLSAKLTGIITAFAFYSATLTATQVAAITAAMQAL